jgi:hypothetical protein
MEERCQSTQKSGVLRYIMPDSAPLTGTPTAPSSITLEHKNVIDLKTTMASASRDSEGECLLESSRAPAERTVASLLLYPRNFR